MVKLLFSSSSPLTNGVLVAVAHIGLLLLLTAPAVPVFCQSQSQFCDECAPQIYDISQLLSRQGIVTWGRKELRSVLNETELPGSGLVYGNITLGTHWSTHVDSPAHSGELYKKPGTILSDGLNLNTLIGPVMVVDTPRDSNITATVLQSLNLPAGLKRVIFKTANTDRRLKDLTTFASDYTGITFDGAVWLVNNTAIEFVGIDYMSIATFDEIVPVHKTFFSKSSIIPVECLNLDDVEPGSYTVYCLPLKVSAEGAPTRCILVK